MNCRQFENRILHLVRDCGRLDPDDPQALEHGRGCPHCSALLANQQSLSAAFRLAAADDVRAPEHIETELISAFRRRRAEMIRDTAPLPVKRSLPARYLGIAAVLLIGILGIVAFHMLRTSHPEEALVSGPATPASTQPAALPAPGSIAPTPRAPQLAEKAEPAARPAVLPRLQAEKAAPEIVEIATDFFALTPGAELAGMESGQLVRVQLPRNVLASFGLPVNQERLNKPVTAQVLIGQDGIARAIRFLSEQNASFIQAGMESKH
jgi:hypothetical protein